MQSLLSDPMIRVGLASGEAATLTLPEVYAALAVDAVEDFVALRPHQRHPWHALLAQLGAVACLRAGEDASPPKDAARWGELLAALTPGHPGGEPWSLVAPPDKPAFLQPVAGPLADLKPLSTPDELDMLVTAKNHDLKGARIGSAMPDDWLFALVALQTSEGFLGAGNFGISRMNGGFSNRPGIGLAPPGGIGAHVFRDIGRLIAMLDDVLERADLYDEDGLALVWLEPWDGTGQLKRQGLHPYYIEICRRVRLVEAGDVIGARVGNSKVARIAMDKDENGVTGDAWAPVVLPGEGSNDRAKTLTVDGRGFDYRRLSDIVFRNGLSPALLQDFGPGESGDGWSLLCRAMVRGQGKTEGYHERRVRMPARVVGRMKSGDYAALGAVSAQRIAEAGAAARVLNYALMTLFQNGPAPGDHDGQDPSSKRRAERFLKRFNAAVDEDFFEALFDEAKVDDLDQRVAIRKAWLESLLRRAQAVLDATEAGTPTSATRRHRAKARAQDALVRRFRAAKELRDYFRSVADVE